MAVIFWLSAQPDLDSGLGIVDESVASSSTPRLLRADPAVVLGAAPGIAAPSAMLAAAVIALLYAVSDEYHQSFVEGRDGRPLDVLIDLAGILIASLCFGTISEFGRCLTGRTLTTCAAY